jgi:hypothetical protein
VPRRKAAGQLGDRGVEGARDVADEIESVLVGESNEIIGLAGDRAKAVYHLLNVSVGREDTEAMGLFRAVTPIAHGPFAQS